MDTAATRTQVRFRNILFATDFSQAAAQAIPYVKKIAEHYDADLVTLYVRPPVVNPMTPPANWPSYIEAAAAEDDVHRQEVLNTFAGIRTQALIEEGDIQGCLAAAIEKNNTDLVIIGTRGRTGLGKLLLGSVAEEIFRTVSCPVLTVGPHSDSSQGPSGELREILYATDLSPESRAAAPYAISLAKEFQARLILMHVITEQPEDLVVPVNVKAGLEKLLRELVPPEAEASCKPEYIVECGDPADMILKFADVKKMHLIVLGVRPEKGAPGAETHHLPTAIAYKIVAHAECPVLTVRH
ncbi:MAG TPA: universal stress protein [Candidatus Acidoferrum sp.]|nr:universal stress protein [Candidatus Acidoferrum sp.]